jgi:hypothetical protein
MSWSWSRYCWSGSCSRGSECPCSLAFLPAGSGGDFADLGGGWATRLWRGSGFGRQRLHPRPQPTVQPRRSSESVAQPLHKGLVDDVRQNSKTSMFIVVGRGGIEPPTLWLKARCSTTELAAPGARRLYLRTQRIPWPIADCTSSVPRIAVWFCESRIGLISTRSSAMSRPASATISITMCASR